MIKYIPYGYDAMIVKDAENRIRDTIDDLAKTGSMMLEISVQDGTISKTVYATSGLGLRRLLEQAGIISDNPPIKAIHIGYPLGGIFDPNDPNIEAPLSPEIFEKHQLYPGGHEIRVIREDVCMVNYMCALAEKLRSQSCGCCVFCREGLRQLQCITDDISKGKSTPDDLELIRKIAGGLSEGSRCLFGRAAGNLLFMTVDGFGAEIEAHIRRRQCPAMVCKSYTSYHVLGSKCDGCEICTEVCPKDAIAGSGSYIHVIDQYECNRCGMCAEKCPQGAIVKAGSIKPRTPEEPIPVGSWRGK